MLLDKEKNNRVVITGLGVISSLGNGCLLFWKNLIAGKSGIKKIKAFDSSKYDRHYAGEVNNFINDFNSGSVSRCQRRVMGVGTE